MLGFLRILENLTLYLTLLTSLFLSSKERQNLKIFRKSYLTLTLGPKGTTRI